MAKKVTITDYESPNTEETKEAGKKSSAMLSVKQAEVVGGVSGGAQCAREVVLDEEHLHCRVTLRRLCQGDE